MKRLLPLLFVIALALFGCVEEEPECDFDDDTSCTCDDGTEGELDCADGTMHCICDGDDE